VLGVEKEDPYALAGFCPVSEGGMNEIKIGINNNG